MDYFEQESKRLRFRKLVKSDIEPWVKFFENNNSLHFLGINLTKSKETLARDWVLKQLERYEKQGLVHLAAIEKSSGRFIGLGGIIPRDLENETVHEIAYSLLPEFWGKGFATELAQQMKVFGFEKPVASKFVSIIDKENFGSINVAKKNGMSVSFETEYLGMQVYVYSVEVEGNS